MHDVIAQFDTGSVIDVDSHELIPMHLWDESFGEEVAALLAPVVQGQLTRQGKNSTIRPDISGDVMEITPEIVWNHKGPDAPAAIDLRRRPSVLDTMGIDRQLVFPTFALIGVNLFYNQDAASMFKVDLSGLDQRAVGQATVEAHNAWAMRMAQEVDGCRVRPVGIVLSESVESMVATAAELIDAGIRALWIPSGVPPAGISPAAPDLDEFWSLAERSDVPVLLHIGSEFSFTDSGWYRDVPVFEFGKVSSLEFPVEPYRATAVHFAVEAMLGAMVLGGVFERHPALRFGVIECGSHWVIPLAEKLDLWAGEFESRLSSVLSMPPSAYLQRNVRVTPFVFEPVATYIHRRPDLAEMFCFSTDYPHVEGGREPHVTFCDELRDLDDVVLDGFFRSNGELLLPA